MFVVYVIIHHASLSHNLLTVLQDRTVGDVALVCLVLRGNRRKLDVAGVEDGSQSAVNATQLLQK